MKQSNGSSLACLRRIEELEQLAEDAPGLIGWKLLDEEQFFVLLMQLKKAVPEEIGIAVQVETRVATLLSDARRQAEAMFGRARPEADQVRSDAERIANEMVGSAQNERNRLLESAREQAATIVAEATEAGNRLVGDYILIQQANQLANEIRDRARLEREQFEGEVERYADAVLNQAGVGIDRLRSTVARAKVQIEQQAVLLAEEQ